MLLQGNLSIQKQTEFAWCYINTFQNESLNFLAHVLYVPLGCLVNTTSISLSKLTNISLLLEYIEINQFSRDHMLLALYILVDFKIVLHTIKDILTQIQTSDILSYSPGYIGTQFNKIYTRLSLTRSENWLTPRQQDFFPRWYSLLCSSILWTLSLKIWKRRTSSPSAS